MNARIATAVEPRIDPATAPVRIALLGTGTVGRAVLARLAQWSGTPLGARLSLVYAANSRFATGSPFGLPPWSVEPRIGGDAHPSRLDTVVRALAGDGLPADSGSGEAAQGERGRIVIDATASEAVAGHHAAWLTQGIHVVTASKLGQGTSLARWRAIQTARAAAGTQYGDSATVGAGLPLLRCIRELRAGGDRIHAIAGVLSGSLAWLFNHYDGLRPWSGFVREACAAGYTEPDPRDDLSGEDVRRKLLILARAAGVALEAGEVDVESLLPPALVALQRDRFDAELPTLDVPLRERHAAAWKTGARLRFVARIDCGLNGAQARVGLESLAADHPLAGGAGTDNRVAIWSDRYRTHPLLIQGPGAGADITAAALLDDVLRIARRHQPPAGAW
ncbi:MAG: homoserine dehydrogenase [Lysobacter sp.]